MYTCEIIETIKRNNGILTQAQYMDIRNTSPQILEVRDDPDNYTKFNHYVFRCSDYDKDIKFVIVA